MKQQLLTTAFIVTAIVAMVSMAQAQVQFHDCAKTRLGCLDSQPIPIVEIPEIKIGLQLQITCSATDANGQDYSIFVKQIKNVSVSEGSIVNYYLSEGEHGTLQYTVEKANATSMESPIASGHFFQSQGTQNLEAGNTFVKITAHGGLSTRVGHYVNDSELVFSDVSVNNVAHTIVPQLQIFSLVDKSVYFNDLKDIKEVSNVELKFVNSNCTYN